MVLPDTVKKHPVISLFAAAIFIGGPAVTASIYSQGSFAGGEGCGRWQKMVNPNTGDAFTSVNEFESFVQGNGGSVPKDLELDVRNGVLYKKVGCVGMTGGISK